MAPFADHEPEAGAPLPGGGPPQGKPERPGLGAALAWIGLLGLAAAGAVVGSAWFFEHRAEWTGFVLYATGALAITGRLAWFLRERRQRGEAPGLPWTLRFRAAADTSLAVPFLLMDSLGVEGVGLATGVALFVADALGQLADGPPRSSRPGAWRFGLRPAEREERLPGALPPG